MNQNSYPHLAGLTERAVDRAGAVVTEAPHGGHQPNQLFGRLFQVII